MAWFKIDDNFYDHPKVDDLSLEAVGIWTLCGTYAARHLTDGFIPARRLTRLGGTDDLAQELVDAELWDPAEGGYVFRNWSEYQPTRESVESRRESDRERKRKQRRNSGGQFQESEKSHTVTSSGLTKESQRESHRPDPTRPDPSIDSLSSHVASDDDGKSDTATEPEFSEDVHNLAQHLAEWIIRNGNRKPNIGKTWLQAIDRLIRIDGYTPDQIRQVIDWSQNDEFWQGNILSAPKLRKQFDQLKNRMFQQRNRQQPANGIAPGSDRARTAIEIGQRLQAQHEQQREIH